MPRLSSALDVPAEEAYAQDPASFERDFGCAMHAPPARRRKSCDHSFEPAVDHRGRPIEPAYDVCTHCGCIEH